MKGEIFNLLENFIVDRFGVETFERIFEQVHEKLVTKEPFIGPGTYPDQDFLQIVSATVSDLGIPLSTAVFEFGRYCFAPLAAKLPHHTAKFLHPKPLILSIHDVIHVEVKKLYEFAEPPDFIYEDIAPDKLNITYRSKRKLYDFVEGIIQGAAEHFEVPIKCERGKVTEGEIGECEFFLTFGTPA